MSLCFSVLRLKYLYNGGQFPRFIGQQGIEIRWPRLHPVEESLRNQWGTEEGAGRGNHTNEIFGIFETPTTDHILID